jgi:N-acetylmuramoyl-L-alanine amidase
MAARENMSDTLAGLPEEAAREEVSDILFDLTRRETRAFSRHFADLLVDGLGEATRLINNPHRSARFRVLTAHDVPSALLEIGYLSNDQDAALMVRPAWQRRTAGAIARAVERFLAGRGDDRAALDGG